MRADRARPAPFRPGDLHQSWTAQVLASTDVDDVLAAQGALPNRQVAVEPERPVMVGRLVCTPRPLQDGEALFLVVSRSNGQPSQSLPGAGKTEGASRGWDGRFAQLADRRPWLSGARATTLPTAP